MKRPAPAMLIFGAVLFGGCDLSHGPQSELVEGDHLLVLENTTLIDGTGASPRSGAVVIIQDSQIVKVGQTGDFRYPEDATVHDLSGRFVMPGLIEAHAHLPGPALQEEMLRTYVAFGVTTLFDPAAIGSMGIEVRERVSTGELFGPRILTAGRALNGPSFLDGFARFTRVETAEEVVAEVQRQADLGVDFIKVYAHLPPKHVRATIEEAHRLGIPVVGHLGRTGWTDAARAGIDIIVHSALAGPTWELVPAPHRNDFRDLYLPSANYPEDYDASRFRPWRELVKLDGAELETLIELLLENGTVVDPNLVVMESIIWGDDAAARERLEPDFAPEPLRTQWRQGLNPGTATWSEEDFAEAKATWPLFLDFVRILHERGVPLTAGTDLANPWITPGPALHRELELLVSAGIPPLEVLTMVTANPAEALGILEETGTVEAGKRADLVILAADPVHDIRNTRKIETVIMGGRSFDPDSLLAVGPVPVRAQDLERAPRPEDTEVWVPSPPVVTPSPSREPGAPPSDAIVLFDGNHLSEWVNTSDGKPAGWPVSGGVATADSRVGNIETRRRFGDYQLHIEWQIPAVVEGSGQARANSGVFLASTGDDNEGYELQILESYENETYVNGMAGSVYKQGMPLANPSRPPGEWQTYDVTWTAPRFHPDGALKSPAVVSVFFNGVLVQDRFELKGETLYAGEPRYRPHGNAPIKLQAHPLADPQVGFRNIWVRSLTSDSGPEAYR